MASETQRPTYTALPLRYFTFGQLCLWLAFAVPAIAPRSLVGFHYHPRMVAVVHLITLGWLTGSILGVVYMLFPIALRGQLVQDRRDWGAWWLFVIGVSGMVAHFWMDKLSGMVWSSALVVATILWVAGRVFAALRRAKLPTEVALHFRLALLNVLMAVSFGMMIGLDKTLHFLPGNHLARVWAHGHLAALGWVTMMILAAGYRLLPMFLPAAMPTGRWVWASALLLEGGILMLAVALIGQWPWAPFAALVVVAGLAVFASRLVWMVRRRRPAPPTLLRPDFAMGHVASAVLCLALACTLGVAILLAPRAPWKMKTILAYGVLGLVGFLAQMVVGVSARLIPLYNYLRALPGSNLSAVLTSPYALPNRRLQAMILLLWSLGVPLLAAGFASDSVTLVRTAATLLATAVTLDLAHQRIQRAKIEHGKRATALELRH